MNVQEGRWATRPLGELVDILDGRRVPVSATERASRPGSVPYYGAAGRVGSIDAALFDEPLLLLGEDGVQFFDRNKPKAYLIDGPAWVNNHAHVLRVRAEVLERRFLLHFLNIFDYGGYANGTTRLKLTQAAMRRIPVPVPDVGEQRRIVDLLEDHLSRLDAARGGLGSAELRVKALELAFAAELRRQPWPRRRLLDVLDASIGGLWGAPPGEDEVDVDVLRVTELKRAGRIDPRSAARRSVSRRQLATRQLEPGDLLLEKSGGGPTSPVGRVGLVPNLERVSVCSNFMQLMRPSRRQVVPEFLHAFLNALHLTGGTLPMQKASTNIRNLKASEYLEVQVPVPPMGEQIAWVEGAARRRESMDRLSEATGVALRRESVLRRALLEAAFSGRLASRSSVMDRVEELAGV